MRIQTQYNFKRKVIPYVKQVSLTMPDQSLTLRQILERYAKGLPISGLVAEEIDDENADAHEFTKMDKIEKVEYVRNYKEYVKKLEAAEIAKQKKAKAAEAKAIEDGQKDKIGRKTPLSSSEHTESDPSIEDQGYANDMKTSGRRPQKEAK